MRKDIADRLQFAIKNLERFEKDEPVPAEAVAAFWSAFVDFFDEFVAGEVVIVPGHDTTIVMKIRK